MIKAAAIWYMIDQRCPSYPFLIDLNCPDDASKEQVEAAVREWFTANIQDSLDDLKHDEREANIEIEWANDYADLRIALNVDHQIVFVGLPEHLRIKFGITCPAVS